MNALAEIQPPRPSLYSTKRYTAFRIGEINHDKKRYGTRDLGINERQESLDGALMAALSYNRGSPEGLFHKDRLLIREIDDELGTDQLHLYAIRQKSSPRYVYHNHVQRREFDLWADYLCTVNAEALKVREAA